MRVTIHTFRDVRGHETRVELTINETDLARRLARKALDNPSRTAALAEGAAKVRIL